MNIYLTSPLNDNTIFLSSMKKEGLIRRRVNFYFRKKSVKTMEKSIIQKDIEYFASKYSLIEVFHSIWVNYSVLKAGNEPQKKKKH